MAEERLPLLRGKISSVEAYEGISTPRTPALDMTAYDIAGQRDRLLQQLDLIARASAERPAGQRDDSAAREVIAIHPKAGKALVPDQLDDTQEDARLIGVRPQSGAVLLDVASADLDYLREKIRAFGDDSKVVNRVKDDHTTSHRAHERAIAPIEEIRIAPLADVWGEPVPPEVIDRSLPHWLQLGCRGGYRRAAEESKASRLQIRAQLHALGALPEELAEYVAPELIYFFARLSFAQLEALRAATDCIFDVTLAPGPIRDLYLAEEIETRDLKSFELLPPDPDAPSVVILDTGISTGHPLLKAAILTATAAKVIGSPEDTYGHGTKMAGISLYRDLGAAIDKGSFQAPHWLQSARVLIEPSRGLGSDEHHEEWPALTQECVRLVEQADACARDRAFVLAISRSMQVPPLDSVEPTLWSHCIEQLAFGPERGRLMIVAAGNAREERWLELAKEHPQKQLSELVHQPAQASNALTVGAFTERTAPPPLRDYAEVKPVAPLRGGISPFTSTGLIGKDWSIKPDVVMEGGNLGMSPALLDGSVPTFGALTTSHRHREGRPLGMHSMTSEASARAAHLAARIWNVERGLWAETVRGLIVHSASWTEAMKKQFEEMNDRVRACGYGVPDERLASECAQGVATIFVEDAMPNAVAVEEPKRVTPKRPTTKATELKLRRKVKLFRLPLPESLLDEEDAEAELRVTLSYFAEPNTFGRQTFHGLDLMWDMQGPLESETQFLTRINKLKRARTHDGKLEKATTKSFKWEIGIRRRSRGTVQSDRWRGRMSSLVGDKLIAVVPVLGWWDQRQALKQQELRFSLIVSVLGPGVYSAIKPMMSAQAAVDVEV